MADGREKERERKGIQLERNRVRTGSQQTNGSREFFAFHEKKKKEKEIQNQAKAKYGDPSLFFFSFLITGQSISNEKKVAHAGVSKTIRHSLLTGCIVQYHLLVMAKSSANNTTTTKMTKVFGVIGEATTICVPLCC
jgi:hypothetical protein